MKVKLCIDPGHGMGNRKSGVYDPGAQAGGVSEADIALQWALTLKWACQRAGVDFWLTRDDDRDEDFVGTRDDRAEDHGCTHFVSLHCNSAGPLATGVETYYRDVADYRFAQWVHRAALNSMKSKDRGLKSEGQSQHPRLAVFDFDGPAALVELGFITNPLERRKLLWRDCRLDFAVYLASHLKSLQEK